MDRRSFLIGMMASLFIKGCSRTFEVFLQPRRSYLLFGLGEDPEKMVNGYDPDGARVLNLLKPDILCFWLNGARDAYSGKIYGYSMSYIRDWAQKRRFEEWSRMGYELMMITWENYDGQNKKLGPPTLGEYHISQTFLDDLKETISILKSQSVKKVYIALATEQSTYTACRYSSSCEHRIPFTDSINSLTMEYYKKLRDNLLKAIDLIESSGLNAEYGICFGGWLVEFPEGVEFIRFFEPVLHAGNAVFFQSMFNYKMSENNGYGNPQRILKNCQFFSTYKKPIHLAHYMPVNKRADVVADDLRYMRNPDYIKQLYNLGLRSFSFMEYGVVKDNLFNSLNELISFRNNLKEVKP